MRRSAAVTPARLFGVTLLLGLSTCGDESTKYRAIMDYDTADANVVVKVGQCTGTLVTPRIVMTASHCIRGAEKPAGPDSTSCAGDSTPYVSIGRSWLSPIAVFESAGSVTKVETCQPLDRDGEDLALVYLTKPVVSTYFSDNEDSVPRVVRPSLVTPKRDNDHFDGIVDFAGFSPWDDDYRTILFTTRRLQPLMNIRVSHENRNGGAFFSLELPEGSGVRAGDSGGPMFLWRPDGSRDPMGVLSQSRGHTAYLSDVAWPGNKKWILAHVTERGIADMTDQRLLPASMAHTQAWLARHGKTPDDWWGELDYSGPCDHIRDQDCDGWWDHGDDAHPVHDDCLDVADPLQQDLEDDGQGDACTTAPIVITSPLPAEGP